MIKTFLDGLDELYYRAKLGEDRTTHAGCRSENMVFVFFVFFCFVFVMVRVRSTVCMCVRGVHSSNKQCVAVYWPISTMFSAIFAKSRSKIA